MNALLIRMTCVAATICSVGSAAGADAMIAPMSWSSDSRWLAYTALHDPALASLPKGWILGGGSPTEVPIRPARAAPHDPAEPATYRIWAADQSGHTTVLIEESRWPLSAPAWGPRGKSISFCRFVPQSGAAAGASQPGHLEVVVQKGLDEKTVIWTSPEFLLDEAATAAFPNHRCSWSPDGVFLAIPRPGRVPSIDVIRTDTRKRVHILDHAILPTWSPDGSMCAYIRRGIGNNNLEIIHRRGQVFSEPRDLLATGPVTAAPFWSADGRSILVASEKRSRPNREFELVRCPIDSTEPARVLNLLPDPVRRVAKLRGIAIDFDKEGETSFHAADLENREAEVIANIVGDAQLHRRFHPVDPSMRIGAIAVSPDGHCVAVRLWDSDRLSHPAFWSAQSEQTRLLIPDEPARRQWQKLLVNAAERVLGGSLGAIVVGGQSVERPSILPLPGELAGPGSEAVRLWRIADLGQKSLSSDDEPAERAAGETEPRLLFNYLRGDFRAAAADLDVLDAETTDLDQRQTLLGLRALVRWARGDLDEARQMIGYLVSTTGTADERVEYTALGLVRTKVVSPAQAWAGFLSTKAAQARSAEPQPGEGSDPFGLLEGRDQKPLLELPGLPPFEPGGAGGPFAPLPAPDLDPAPGP